MRIRVWLGDEEELEGKTPEELEWSPLDLEPASSGHVQASLVKYPDGPEDLFLRLRVGEDLLAGEVVLFRVSR